MQYYWFKLGLFWIFVFVLFQVHCGTSGFVFFSSNLLTKFCFAFLVGIPEEEIILKSFILTINHLPLFLANYHSVIHFNVILMWFCQNVSSPKPNTNHVISMLSAD